jgi:hypothetical protein
VTSGFDNTDGIDGQEASLRLEPEDLLEDHSGADVLELGLRASGSALGRRRLGRDCTRAGGR